MKDGILSVLQRTHEEQPRKQGLAMGSVPGQLDAEIDEDVLQQAVDDLVVEGEVRNDGSILSLTGFDPLGSLPETGAHTPTTRYRTAG